MPQETFVTKVPKGAFQSLEASVARGPFEFRSVPHAVFSAKGDGVVATLYTSGKLVIQGADPQGFLARWTSLDGTPAPSKSKKKSSSSAASQDEPLDLEPPVTGSDEAGKGDYFGPLVVAAVRADADGIAKLEAMGVRDSKTLTDARALRLGAALAEEFEHSVRRVDPNEYNRVYPTFPALNQYLAQLHGEVLGDLAQEGENVLVDQFERRGLVRAAVAEFGVRLTEVPRAERHAVVAAASIIARREFLLGLKELSEDFGMPLHKGAGAPVDRVGVDLVREQGEEALHGAAKLHFKNTEKILGRV